MGLDKRLEAHGFARRRLGPKATAVWELRGECVTPQFFPDVIRRQWRYHLTGAIGLDMSDLRAWLNDSIPRVDHGIFVHSFVGWHLANEPALGLMAKAGDKILLDEWVAQIKSKLTSVPRTREALVEAYLTKPVSLGRFASGNLNERAWEFLSEWTRRGEAPPVPQR